MSSIVGGFATSHVLFPAKDVAQQAARVVAGMMKIRAGVKLLKPDALVVVSSDHMNNFTLAQQIPLAVGVADEFIPLGDMGLPRTPFRGCRPLAEAFVRRAAERGLDLVQVEEVKPDHGMTITKLIADTNPTTPVVPVYINTNMPVPPTPARCYALGGVLKETVEAEGANFGRVVVIGGGGLSHWLCTPEEGRVNEAFDRRFLDLITSGRAAELAQLSPSTLEAEAGNGGLELAGWLFVAGALPHARGETVYYEPIPQWITGMGGIALRP
jgi:aromatic ring-opening dioxygenase catalytic subunit (LigB family)